MRLRIAMSFARIVPSMDALPAITFAVSPETSFPTVMTPMPRVRSMLRATSCWSAISVLAATTPVRGIAPCACTPSITISKESIELRAVPGTIRIFPECRREDPPRAQGRRRLAVWCQMCVLGRSGERGGDRNALFLVAVRSRRFKVDQGLERLEGRTGPSISEVSRLQEARKAQ